MNFEQFLSFLGSEFSFDTAGITAQTTFAEINFDEFDLIELVMSVEDAYSIEVPDEALREFKTIGDFANYLSERL